MIYGFFFLFIFFESMFETSLELMLSPQNTSATLSIVCPPKYFAPEQATMNYGPKVRGLMNENGNAFIL